MKYVKINIEILSAINVEQEYEKYIVGEKTPEQLQYIGRLIKYYNTTLFEGKLPKYKDLKWLRRGSSTMASYATDNVFSFNPHVFKLPFSKFRETILHEMCHQATDYLPIKEKEEDRYRRFTPHTEPSWMYWTEKLGIDSKSKNSDLISDTAMQSREKGREGKQISKPKKYLPVKFWDGRDTWREGLLIQNIGKRIEKWEIAIIDKKYTNGAIATILLERIYEVSPEIAAELKENKKLRSVVNRRIKE